VALCCLPQRDSHEIHYRIDFLGERPSDLLVKAKEGAMVWSVSDPRSENVANAACQYEIVVSLVLS